MPEFDYIIVGAGSAGGVLAARLSEDADLRVLLIEVGGRTDHWSIRMPAALSSNFEGGPWNWCYYSVPQRHLAGRRIFQPRGNSIPAERIELRRCVRKAAQALSLRLLGFAEQVR